MSKSRKKVKLNKKKFTRFLILCAVLIFALLFLFTPLFLKLNGEKRITVALGEEYVDEGAKAFFGLGKVKVKGEVDTSKLGTYKIKYKFLTESVKRIVTVEDQTAPAVTLEGPSTVYLMTGSSYEEYGYSAEDSVDGDVSASVTITIKYTDPSSGLEAEVQSVDTNKEGSYEISYIASDSAGNKARERRTVEVSEDGPMTADLLSFNDIFTQYYSDIICKEVGTDEDKFADLTLFGDSFIEKLGAIGIVPYKQLWSRPSTTSTNIHEQLLYIYGSNPEVHNFTFFDAMDEYEPENLLMLINSDETLTGSPDHIQKDTDALYKEIKEKYPNTNVIICSLMPVEDYYDEEERVAKYGMKRNERINQMNVIIADLCRQYGFKYMNAAEAVRNPETGACYDEYIYEKDGVHLSNAGCEVMLEYIKSHLDY